MAELSSLGLWNHLNAEVDVLIDLYESEDIPVRKIERIAVAIRSFMTDGPPLDVEARNALIRIFELLELALDKRLPVRFAL